MPHHLPPSPYSAPQVCQKERRQVDGERERQTWAPQVLPRKCTDCEITPGLDNLPPPRWNPWGTEIINLLISYTLLFPFFLEQTIANRLHIRFLCQLLGDKTHALEEIHSLPAFKLKWVLPSEASSPSPLLPTRPGGWECLETECFWRERFFFCPWHRAFPPLLRAFSLSVLFSLLAGANQPRCTWRKED